MVECQSTEEAERFYDCCDRGDFKINDCYSLYPSFVTPTETSVMEEVTEPVVDVETEGMFGLIICHV